jgi:hypothetical protein
VSQHLLFSKTSVFDVMEHQKRRVRDELQRLPLSRLEDAELPLHLAAEYGMDVPVLDEARKYAKTKETQVDVSRDPTRYISNRSRPFLMPGTELNLFVPFTGDPGVFDVRPSSFDMNPPRGEVIGNELCFMYKFVEAPINLTTEYERTIAQVKKHLDWLRPSAAQLQSEILQLAQTLVSQRKQQAAAHAQALGSLGIPIREDERSDAAPPAHPLAASSSSKTGKRNKVREGRPTGWDIFISHASEDKEAIARPLADALTDKGLTIWYDEFSLTVGDSLRESIDRGLARSRYGVVILSPHFFEKHWPRQELNGLATREVSGNKVILPVWHNVGFDEVREFSPTLADRLAVTTDKGLDHVVKGILDAMK